MDCSRTARPPPQAGLASPHGLSEVPTIHLLMDTSHWSCFSTSTVTNTPYVMGCRFHEDVTYGSGCCLHSRLSLSPILMKRAAMREMLYGETYTTEN